MSDFLNLQLAADELNHLVRGYAFRFVNDKEARERSIHEGFGVREDPVMNRTVLGRSFFEPSVCLLVGSVVGFGLLEQFFNPRSILDGVIVLKVEFRNSS